MQGIVTFSIVEESHTGPIGDDWKYWVEAKVYNEGLKGEALISIPKHSLPDGVVQKPPGPAETIRIPSGDPTKPILIKITAEATEVDTFKNDIGKKSLDLTVQCPGDKSKPLIFDKEIEIGVVESPALTGATSIFKIKARFELSCE